MTTDLWVAVASVSLALAVATRMATMLGAGESWGYLTFGARLVALIALACSLIVLAAPTGTWLFLGARPWALSLALATQATYLVLVARTRADAAAPVLDLTVLLIVVAALAPGPEPKQGWGCDPCAPVVQIQWVLLLVGMSAAITAGSAGLLLGLRAALAMHTRRLCWPRWVDQHVLLDEATMLAAVALGAGLTLGMWWGWQTAGLLLGRVLRLEWAAITWMLVAMCLVARLTGRRWWLWTAGLAIVAAVVALLGLFLGIAS